MPISARFPGELQAQFLDFVFELGRFQLDQPAVAVGILQRHGRVVDDLGADSLDTVELVMALEEEFECEIPDEEAEKITTVQQAIDYIEAHS